MGYLLDAVGAAPDFHEDVVPILREYCVGCHNEDDYEGDFSVETFRALMEGGESGEAIVAGDGHASLLVKTLTGRSKPSMPPKKEPKPEAAEVAILKAWIEAGARGPALAEDESILATLHVPKIAAASGVARPVTALAFSPDGRRLAIARYAGVEVREMEGQKTVLELGEHPGKVNAVHFSPDGKMIATASGITGLRGVATIWNAATGEPLRELSEGHRDTLFDAEFSPDGKLLATAGYDRRITFWDIETGEAVRRIDVHNGAVFDLAFSPDGTILASASADETVKLWKVSTGERLDTLKEPQDEQYSVAFTPDGKFVIAAGADKCIRMWRLLSRDTPRINPLVRFRFAHEDEIVQIGLTPGGDELISSSADRTLKTWSLPGLDPGRVHEGQSDLVAALAVAPGGRSFTAARMDGTMQTFATGGVSAGVGAPRGGESAADEKADSGTEGAAVKVAEAEPNDAPGEAAAVDLPAEIRGTIGREGDVDMFRFEAKAGETWVFEVDAARQKSPLDSKIEVLDAKGEMIERVVLQAVQDSWFTFRGKDSTTSGDFRVQNWREMELNEYLYANGEVTKLWLYPRGPDSGFKVYPGFGSRHTFFGTSAMTHPMGEPCYIVQPIPAGSKPGANGLPVFRVYYENDDEPKRRWGNDSWLAFTAPADGKYLVRLRDVRGFGGDDFSYLLKARRQKPDFRVTVTAKNLMISPGSGKEFTLKVERMDEFDGEIRVDVEGLPEGFTASTPVVIEKGQYMAMGVINASLEAMAPDAEAAESAKLTARATIGGREVKKEVGTLKGLGLGKAAKVTVAILPNAGAENVVAEPGKPIEFTIAPGETISARVVATRVDFKERIALGKEDSGRNLPHGVFVDNVGLSGLLIVPGQDEREFFLTAAKWVPESTRYFHLVAGADGGQASLPAILHVRNPEVSRR